MWIYGKHAVVAALDNPKRHVKSVAVCKPDDTIEGLVRQNGVPLQQKEQHFFQKTFGPDAVHQGIAADVEPLSHGALEDMIHQCEDETSALFVMLDQVTDPHNVGAIARSAAAFGAKSLIHPKHKSAPQDSAIIAKTACGAIEHIAQHVVTNFAQTMALFKQHGYWVIGLDERGETIQKAPLRGKIVLVLGAEGKGLRRLTKDNCDILASLPTHPSFPTLNVSNAAALAFYEYTRQNS